jgi:hypothetical protein
MRYWIADAGYWINVSLPAVVARGYYGGVGMLSLFYSRQNTLIKNRAVRPRAHGRGVSRIQDLSATAIINTDSFFNRYGMLTTSINQVIQ